MTRIVNDKRLLMNDNPYMSNRDKELAERVRFAEDK